MSCSRCPTHAAAGRGRFVRVGLAFAAIARALACASGQLEPRTAHDPANPAAPEAPQVRSPVAHATPSAEAAVAYVCPMHPDVVRQEPGVCPKCGMTLVSKARH